jgi:tyrosinase
MSTTLFVRRDVSSLGATDPTLSAYGRAIAAMKAKPDADPTSWTFQAAIHGTLASSPLAGQNQCQHATWFFVSWHRMYLYYFERIVRAEVERAGRPGDWALPYWNYEDPGRAALPVPFRTPADPSNPLFVSQRGQGVNAGYALPAGVTSPRFAISRPLFTGAAEFGGGQTPVLFQVFQGPTGRLEQTPHHDVHGRLGGWMGHPETAAQDPIFWLHHANIDRLWVEWVRQGRQDPTDAAWLNQPFDFFDIGGKRVTLTAAQVLDTVADLNYTYDVYANAPPVSTPPPASQPRSSPAAARISISLRRDPELVGALTEPLQLVGAEVSAQLPLDPQATAAALSTLATTTPRVLLQLHEIQAEEVPETVYGVYVDLPSEPTEEEQELHHVGNLSFFGVKRAQQPNADTHPHGLTLTYEITQLVQVERAAGTWNGSSIAITFKPMGLIPPEGEAAIQPATETVATVGSISLYYA